MHNNIVISIDYFNSQYNELLIQNQRGFVDLIFNVIKYWAIVKQNVVFYTFVFNVLMFNMPYSTIIIYNYYKLRGGEQLGLLKPTYE